MIVRLLGLAPLLPLAACTIAPDPRPDPGPWDPFVMTYEIGDATTNPQTCGPRTVPIDPPAIEAGTVWDVDGVTGSLYAISERSYGADWLGEGCFLLAPAGLRLDLTTLGCGYGAVRIPISDGCPGGCTTVQVIGGGEVLHDLSTTASGDHTFVIADCGAIDSILVESSEGVVCPVDLW